VDCIIGKLVRKIINLNKDGEYKVTLRDNSLWYNVQNNLLRCSAINETYTSVSR